MHIPPPKCPSAYFAGPRTYSWGVPGVEYPLTLTSDTFASAPSRQGVTRCSRSTVSPTSRGQGATFHRYRKSQKPILPLRDLQLSLLFDRQQQSPTETEESMKHTLVLLRKKNSTLTTSSTPHVRLLVQAEWVVAGTMSSSVHLMPPLALSRFQCHRVLHDLHVRVTHTRMHSFSPEVVTLVS